MTFDQQHLETIGTGIDCSRQSCRTIADDDDIIEGVLGVSAQAGLLCYLLEGRLAPTPRRQGKEHRHARIADGGCPQQSTRFIIAFNVQPLIRNRVAGQEILHSVTGRRPHGANHADPLEWEAYVGPPFVEQAIKHRIEIFLWRIPWFHQVVIEADLVDGANGDFGVGIGRKQRLARRERSARPVRETVYRTSAAYAGQPRKELRFRRAA